MAEMTAQALWNFSLDRYARPGVSDICLELQEGAGADVNMVLLCLWCGQNGRALSQDQLEQLQEGEAGQWHRDVVLPLRAARKAMKGRSVAGDSKSVEQFRTKIKSLEITSEYWEQQSLASAITQFAIKPEPAGDEVVVQKQIATDNCQRYLSMIVPDAVNAHDEQLAKLVAACID